MKHYITSGFLLAALLTLVGCGPPQVKPNNLRLIASLRTALSAKNDEWLQQNIELIDKRHAAGEMNDDEYEEFQTIIAKAKAGDWQGAERDSVEFQRAQHPTPEQIQQVTRRR